MNDVTSSITSVSSIFLPPVVAVVYHPVNTFPVFVTVGSVLFVNALPIVSPTGTSTVFGLILNVPPSVSNVTRTSGVY